MAIRFDIDKYNKVRDSYLAYIRDGKVDAQLSPLYDTYKTYWANDTEVKKAEQAYKLKKKAEDEKRRKIAEQRRLLDQEQQLRADTRQELPPLNGVLYLKIGNNGRLLNIENTQDFITNTKTYSSIQHILHDFCCYEDVLCSDDYLLILLRIKKQCHKLAPTAQPKKAKSHNKKHTNTKQLFQFTDKDFETHHYAGSLHTYQKGYEARKAPTSVCDSYKSMFSCNSINAYNGGSPGTGKRY